MQQYIGFSKVAAKHNFLQNSKKSFKEVLKSSSGITKGLKISIQRDIEKNPFATEGYFPL